MAGSVMSDGVVQAEFMCMEGEFGLPYLTWANHATQHASGPMIYPGRLSSCASTKYHLKLPRSI